MASWEWIWQESDDMEDWVESGHGGWEAQMIGMCSNTLDNGERSQEVMGEFLGWMHGGDVTGVKINLITNLVLRGQRMALIVKVCHLSLMCSVNSFTVLMCEGVWRGLNPMRGCHPERGLLSGSMDVVIVSKLSQGEKIIPIVLALIDEDADVLLQFLVDSVSLAISLWVIGGRRKEFDPQKSVQVASELCYKLRATVREEGARKSM
ncbi:hypothetical protein L208DRAFT_1245125 [Tricholoma matsutake]|nr:hypothetical protein L208DRAFT_1245125 [Tricholoma matsutake 945]